jgi:hypothetical protein
MLVITRGLSIPQMDGDNKLANNPSSMSTSEITSGWTRLYQPACALVNERLSAIRINGLGKRVKFGTSLS